MPIACPGLSRGGLMFFKPGWIWTRVDWIKLRSLGGFLEFGTAVLAERSMNGVLGLAVCAESPSLERPRNRERFCCAGVEVELVTALALETGYLVLVELPFSLWWSGDDAAAPWTV